MGANVEIRPYQEQDAEALYRAVTESVKELCVWMPWCHPAYSRKEAMEWIEVQAEARMRNTSYEFAIWADGTFAGACGLNRIALFDRVANLGYWTRTTKTCRGFASAAVKKLFEWALINTELNRFEIVAAVRNVPSNRVAEKVGAVREGILRKRVIVSGAPQDAVLYSLIRPSLEVDEHARNRTETKG